MMQKRQAQAKAYATQTPKLLAPFPRRPLRDAVLAHRDFAGHLPAVHGAGEIVSDRRPLNRMPAAEPDLVSVSRPAHVAANRFTLVESSERNAALNNREPMLRASKREVD